MMTIVEQREQQGVEKGIEKGMYTIPGQRCRARMSIGIPWCAGARPWGRTARTIVCGVTIGEYAFVAAGAVINREVPAYALMAGVPARRIGWMSRQGERLALPAQGDGEARCPATGERYQLAGDSVSFIEG